MPISLDEIETIDKNERVRIRWKFSIILDILRDIRVKFLRLRKRNDPYITRTRGRDVVRVIQIRKYRAIIINRSVDGTR